MAVGFFLIPIETVPRPAGGVTRRPKYVATLGVTGETAQRDYGNEPTCLWAADLTAAQRTALSANADVATFPLNIDSLVGAANLATVQNELETRNLPGDMVTAAQSYRLILRGIIAVFSISAKTPLFAPGVTIDTTLGQLTPEARADLKASAESAGYSTAGLTLASTIREALMKAVQTAPVTMMVGVSI